jgi:hypothetical protein
MELPIPAIKIRNLLVCVGSYYLSWFLANPVAMGIGKLTNRITYTGDFQGGVLLPLVIQLPQAVIAAVVGASVVWLVESNRPMRWAVVPTFLYALAVRHFAHWAHPPTLIERAGAMIGGLFPAIACMSAAVFVARRRTAPHVSRSTPH